MTSATSTGVKRLKAASTIELLTAGQVLPLPALDEEHIAVIIEAINDTWKELVCVKPHISCQDTEPQVTAWIEARLNHRLDVDPLLASIVSGVVRGRETSSHDGVHLEIRPDLSFLLVGRSKNFPLHVECKVIRGSTGQRAVDYCGNDGLVRLVDGRYAWWAREAMMLAYVRDGSTTTETLIPCLRAQGARIVSTSRRAFPAGLDGACSCHDRVFDYPLAAGAPGFITIWHVWLRAAPPDQEAMPRARGRK